MDPDYEVSEREKLEAKDREEKERKDQIDRIRAAIEKEFKTELDAREAQLEEIERRITCATKMLHLLRYAVVASYYNREELGYRQTDDEQPYTDGQSRIHPAVKKVVNETTGKCTTATLPTLECVGADDDGQQQLRETKREETAADVVPVRNRPMLRKRLVVGNISKWMPSSNAEDNTTHKWMIYVRGPKEAPAVDDYVQKVVFFLHPSYQPNDIIEIRTPPFHLSRRGWGEFPVRVQIHFHCALNKPMDIVHNLKLDKACTGQQTLGNETVVDLTIQTDDVLVLKSEPLDLNDVAVKTEVEEEEAEDYVDPLLDHSYSLKDGVERKRRSSEEEDGSSKRFKSEEVDYGRYAVHFPSYRFKNMPEAMPYLLKRLPLITPLAADLHYKCTYPYAARSLDEYRSWSVIKRISCEWSRARRVVKIIDGTQLSPKWSTKKIMAYARAHGYSALSDYRMLSSMDYADYLRVDDSRLSAPRRPKLERDIDVTDDDDEEQSGDGSTVELGLGELDEACAFVRNAALDVGVNLKPEEVAAGVRYPAAQRVLLEAVLCLAGNLIRNARGLAAHRPGFTESSCVVGANDVAAVLQTHRTEFQRILRFGCNL